MEVTKPKEFHFATMIERGKKLTICVSYDKRIANSKFYQETNFSVKYTGESKPIYKEYFEKNDIFIEKS